MSIYNYKFRPFWILYSPWYILYSFCCDFYLLSYAIYWYQRVVDGIIFSMIVTNIYHLLLHLQNREVNLVSRLKCTLQNFKTIINTLVGLKNSKSCSHKVYILCHTKGWKVCSWVLVECKAVDSAASVGLRGGRACPSFLYKWMPVWHVLTLWLPEQ